MPRVRGNEWNFAANAAQAITTILARTEYENSPLGHAEPQLTEYRGARRLDLVLFARREREKPLVTGELKVTLGLPRSTSLQREGSSRTRTVKHRTRALW
jgi:hypothetical protein